MPAKHDVVHASFDLNTTQKVSLRTHAARLGLSMRGIVAILLAAFAAVAFADCPDSYWDCLLRPKSGVLVPSGGGLVYGNCWRGWKASAQCVARS